MSLYVFVCVSLFVYPVLASKFSQHCVDSKGITNSKQSTESCGLPQQQTIWDQFEEDLNFRGLAVNGSSRKCFQIFGANQPNEENATNKTRY